MRVGVVVEQLLAPVPGGTARYSRELAAALAARAPCGASVAGFTAWHRDVAAAAIPGVSGPHRLPLPRRALTAGWERGTGPVLPGCDLVHAATPLAPPRRGRPLVVTVHDTVPWTHPQTLTPRGVTWHRRAVGTAMRTADRVVVPTQVVAAELREIFPAAPAQRVAVVGEGVSAALAVPPDAARRADRLALPGRYWFSLATVEPRKGLDVLVTAMALADQAGPPLFVAGFPGWGGVDVDALTRDAGLGPERVRLLGRLTDPDLAVVLSRATALVVPSRAEGFGLPVIEAMSVGTPVVSSDAPALVEVGGGATALVPREDPAALAATLDRLAGDAGERGRLRAAGAVRATAYSWMRAAGRLWELYAELTPPGGGSVG